MKRLTKLLPWLHITYVYQYGKYLNKSCSVLVGRCLLTMQQFEHKLEYKKFGIYEELVVPPLIMICQSTPIN